MRQIPGVPNAAVRLLANLEDELRDKASKDGAWGPIKPNKKAGTPPPPKKCQDAEYPETPAICRKKNGEFRSLSCSKQPSSKLPNPSPLRGHAVVNGGGSLRITILWAAASWK
ncbi:hypothetical protein PG988_015199 [Apiospora saccharicola]